ncbi:hypothetical protein HELRODRAFT_175933 [Helobdella robusta]|uniref:RNase H type-1 domain-containing protein n=1 Tax=Helobdella robusta TaxID=6412 RepID=T1F9X4_HELRO|nr:hypothetical protein HELRODRAFT_175933 [Helobdella robusta]ESO00496.1 hypothetical protein HELRODRAFT_175933 [Helobdella robusta]
MALNHTINETNKEYMIFADSLSSLMAIENHKANNPIITQIQNSINTHMTINNNKIKFVWIPNHIGIEGNEKVDKAANLAHRLPISNIPISYSDIKVQNMWNTAHNFPYNNRVQKIQPTQIKIQHPSKYAGNFFNRENINNLIGYITKIEQINKI